MTVDIFNNFIKFQLDSGSDISIINWRTWRKLNKTDKTAKSVTGENINILGVLILTVTLNGVTKKLKAYVLKDSDNLFGTDWIEKFNLWDSPMSAFCRKIESTTSNSVNLKKELKQRFPQSFSGGLGECSKLKAKLKMKDGAQPVFKKNRNILFVAQEQINKELYRLEQAGILSKTNFIEWAALTVHVKKEVQPNMNLRRFLHRVKRCLAGSPLSSTKSRGNFQQIKWWKIFSKIDLSDAYFQIEVDEESSKLLC